MLSLDVSLKTWRRLSQIQVLQILGSSDLKTDLSTGAKIRLQDALFAEQIVLQRLKNTTEQCGLARNMKCQYHEQAADLDVAKDMCFASLLPDARISSANGFFARRIAGYLGMGDMHPSDGITLGDHCIQIGKFRIGCKGSADLVIGHEKQKDKVMLFTGSDYRNTDRGPWAFPLGHRNGINIGPYCIRIGKYRLGCVNTHQRHKDKENYDSLALEIKGVASSIAVRRLIYDWRKGELFNVLCIPYLFDWSREQNHEFDWSRERNHEFDWSREPIRMLAYNAQAGLTLVVCIRQCHF